MTTTINRPLHEFRSSVSEGKIFEQVYYNKVVAPILRKQGFIPRDLRNDSHYQAIDVDFGGEANGQIVHTIEVKFDHVAAVTGNMFLETVSVDKGCDHQQKPGCFFISEANEFHQVVVLRNQIYVSNLQMMRDYWYGDEAVPRILHHEYSKMVMRNIRAHNDNYDSIGDCVSIDLLFSEKHKHSAHYLLDVYEFNDSILEKFVPLSAKIVDKLHSSRQKNVIDEYPCEVAKWLQ